MARAVRPDSRVPFFQPWSAPSRRRLGLGWQLRPEGISGLCDQEARPLVHPNQHAPIDELQADLRGFGEIGAAWQRTSRHSAVSSVRFTWLCTEYPKARTRRRSALAGRMTATFAVLWTNDMQRPAMGLVCESARTAASIAVHALLMSSDRRDV